MPTSIRVLSRMRIAAALFACLCAVGSARAQLPALPPGAERVLQGQQAGQQNVDTVRPSIQIYQPVAPEQAGRAPPSRLELLYSTRASRPLVQFGYDVLGVPTPVSTAQVGAVQDDYVLGAGDEIIVVLRGQQNETYRQQVDRNGQIILPKLNPTPAAGRSFGDFRADLERQIAQTYISTNAFVSLGQVRQISVLVTGEVRAPGTRILSALSTPLDALLISGGVAKTGSLRNIQLIRGGRTTSIDFYALLTQGNFPSLGLQNGDRIYVPPLQATVAVAGYVRRPGIYELRPGETSLGPDALVSLAGGVEIAGGYRLSKLRLEPNGATQLVALAGGEALANGEILFVDAGLDVSIGHVHLGGAVRLKGDYPRATTPSLSRLVRNIGDVTPEAFTLFAVLLRRDQMLNTRMLVPFSLARVLSGATDISLQDNDFVYVFTRTEIRALADAASRAVVPASPTAAALGTTEGPQRQESQTLSVPAFSPRTPAIPGAPQGAGAVPGGAIANRPENAGDPRLETAQRELTAGTAAIAQAAGTNGQANGPKDILDTIALKPEYRVAIADAARLLGVTTEVLVRAASDHLLWVLDEVRDPGAYLAAGGATLNEAISVAGGALNQADLSFVEVTSTSVDALAGTSQTNRTGYKGNVVDFEKVSLRALDVVRLRPIFSERDQGQVSITGQVRYPGNFDITRSERLSSLLERAGSLTAEAYPYGAIFTRRQAAIKEREANLRGAREIESQITAPSAGFSTTTDQSAGDRLVLLSALAQQLRDAPVLGRIAVTADPAILRVRPELDILLESGDTLYIPKRPATVTVSGEVLNSGSFQYENGLRVRDYVNRAGGTTQGADEERMFLVLPDGSAHPVRESWLAYNNTAPIPPGSTIIVPRDLQPFNLNQFLKDATQIVSQVAVTAASIAVIGR